jgi:hypothetical protein
MTRDMSNESSNQCNAEARCTHIGGTNKYLTGGLCGEGKPSSLKNETMGASYTLSSRYPVANEQSRDPATQKGGSKEVPANLVWLLLPLGDSQK